MKAFLASVVAAVAIAIVAAVVLNSAPMSSEEVFQSPNNTTRL